MIPQNSQPPFGVPNYQEMQSAFKIIQQQQQQQMWYQQQYNQFIIFCNLRGLNPNDQNSFTLFYQQMTGQAAPPNPAYNPSPSPSFNQPHNPPYNPYPSPPFNQPHNPPYNPSPNPSFNQPHNPPYNPSPSSSFNQPHNPPYNPPHSNPAVNQNEPYVHGELKEKLPRGEQTLYVKPDQNYNKNPSAFINISLKASSGLNVILAVPGNITIHEMFKKYMDRLGLPYNYLGKDLQFLYNGNKIDPFSNQTVSSKFTNGINITVFDQGGVIGGS